MIIFAPHSFHSSFFSINSSIFHLVFSHPIPIRFFPLLLILPLCTHISLIHASNPLSFIPTLPTLSFLLINPIFSFYHPFRHSEYTLPIPTHIYILIPLQMLSYNLFQTFLFNLSTQSLQKVSFYFLTLFSPFLIFLQHAFSTLLSFIYFNYSSNPIALFLSPYFLISLHLHTLTL